MLVVLVIVSCYDSNGRELHTKGFHSVTPPLHLVFIHHTTHCHTPHTHTHTLNQAHITLEHSLTRITYKHLIHPHTCTLIKLMHTHLLRTYTLSLVTHIHTHKHTFLTNKHMRGHSLMIGTYVTSMIYYLFVI